MRYNLITASNAYKCFENETSQNSFEDKFNLPNLQEDLYLFPKNKFV